MILQATSFGLYMAGLIIAFVAYLMYYNFGKISVKAYIDCYGIYYICLFLSQIVLCMIFWELGKKRQSQQIQD